nr:GGDEF domain-containing protein [Bacilli bacterium]
MISGIVFDVSETKNHQQRLHSQNEQLRIFMQLDSLTNLLHHQAIRHELQFTIDKYRLTNLQAGILLFDIDNFKKVNDDYGHLKGDEVIITIAKMILHFLDDHDEAGRYGGEEFIVLFKNKSREQMEQIAEQLSTAIRQFDFGFSQPVTVSGGLVPLHNHDLSQWIKQADKLLYAAKRMGKNRILLAPN